MIIPFGNGKSVDLILGSSAFGISVAMMSCKFTTINPTDSGIIDIGERALLS